MLPSSIAQRQPVDLRVYGINIDDICPIQRIVLYCLVPRSGCGCLARILWRPNVVAGPVMDNSWWAHKRAYNSHFDSQTGTTWLMNHVARLLAQWCLTALVGARPGFSSELFSSRLILWFPEGGLFLNDPLPKKISQKTRYFEVRLVFRHLNKLIWARCNAQHFGRPPTFR